MIVLFILNTRLSGLMVQIVTRLSYLKACLFHLRQGIESLLIEQPPAIAMVTNSAGVILDGIEKIKVIDLVLERNRVSLIKHGQLKLHRGVLYGLKGGVGSGKSTLLKTLVGIEREFGGKIEYDGVDINVLDGEFFERRVSFVSAETGFFWCIV